MVDNDCDPSTLDVDDLDNDGFLCTMECDDHDPLAFPSGVEICNDGIDNDCNPATIDLADADMDGYTCDVDCADDDPSINPGQVEIGCDEIDNDCDPATPDLADVDMDGVTCVDATVRGGGATALARASSAKISLINNTFYDNAMPSGIAGGLYVDDMNANGVGIVSNNIFYSNVAELGGGIVHTFFYGELHNNDFFTNAPGDLYDAGGSGASKVGNLFVDPVWESIPLENYRLQEASPLIDAGEPSVAPLIDFNRVDRPYDGDGDMIPLPDIGAFEWPSREVFNLVFTATDSISWDFDDAADEFNVYRANLLNLKNTGNYTQPTQLPIPNQWCQVPATSLPFVDMFEPGTPGTVAYYLVTYRGITYEGSLGNDSLGGLRSNAFPCSQ